MDPPEGKLYGLREQAPPSQRRIIQVIAPQIVTFNDLLIERLKKEPDGLFKISPRKFEEVIADLLADMGMEVELTPATRDGGKDILAYMNTNIGKLLCLVEAKQHNKSKPVGVSLVRTLYGTLMDHQATSGMLVTTSRFAQPAKDFQERHKYQLSLRDYNDVVAWLLKYKSK
jgi:restriction endonuclease Mrr